VSALAAAYRRRGQTVAIVAVDPTSPFTGGAILGDRIRMRDLSGDSGVFIRSMATRGSLGGLARTTRDAVRVLDAAGFNIILLETVGAGQSEVDIARAAHTTLVVEAPGLGDDVQAIKAGILEIADVLVVNKADRPGAENTARALRAMLELGHPTNHGRMVNHHGQMMQASTPTTSHGDGGMWFPPVVRTVASGDAGNKQSDGVAELLDAIDQHRTYLSDGARRAERERDHLEDELRARLAHTLIERVLGSLPPNALNEAAAAVQARQTDPQGAVEALLLKALT
jgi:LAO/AO transport system kinase